MGKRGLTVGFSVIAIWIAFFVAYPVRPWIDDAQHLAILRNEIFHYGAPPFRPLHQALIYLQGWVGSRSAGAAVFVSILFHFAVGWVALKQIVPRYSNSSSRAIATAGLVAFMLHPVAFQTTIHLAQRAEIVATLLSALSIGIVLRALKSFDPHAFLKLAGCAIGAFLAKENYVLVPTLGLVALALIPSARYGRKRQLAIASATCLLLVGFAADGTLNRFYPHGRDIETLGYERSARYFASVAESREVSDADAILFPFRDPKTNLALQIALIPASLRSVLAPVALTRESGQFPFGRDTYARLSPRVAVGAVVGALILAAFLFGVFRLRRRRTELALGTLALAPLALDSVYFAFNLSDPLELYRFYGVAFTLSVVTLPVLLGDAISIRTPRRPSMLAAIAAAFAICGCVRAYELIDPVREARLEQSRNPYDYRAYLNRVRAEVATNPDRADCDGILFPALTLAPTTAPIYSEWAWCYAQRGERQKVYFLAEKSLAQPNTPHNLRLALQYLALDPNRPPIALDRIHPANRKQL